MEHALYGVLFLFFLLKNADKCAIIDKIRFL